MSFDVAEVARKRAAETAHPPEEWARALETARASFKVTPSNGEALRRLAQSSRTPERFTAAARLIYQHSRTDPSGDAVFAGLFKSVDASPFSLADWIDALELFARWLRERNRRAEFSSMMGYLNCCAESPEGEKAGQTLANLADEMLRIFGYEGR